MLKILSVFFLLFFTIVPSILSQTALGDRIDFNQNPNTLVWKKIDTPHFEIIFPSEIEDHAQRATFILEKAYDYVSKSLEVFPRKISIILQNQSVNSNGFVTLAPRRSEWFLTPSIDPEMTNTDWIKTLAIHEFRHVVQFEKSRQNINQIYEIFLGQIGQGLGLVFSFPPWFLEGDAVGIETALTNGGRGRLPRFERDLRTLLLSGKKFDFDKAIMRSYNDWIPNHYVYGYFLTSYMRNTYGDLFLSKVADKSTKKSWNPLAFYNSVDDIVEIDFENIYQNSMSDLLKNWSHEFKKISPTPYDVRHAEWKRDWVNYYYPMIAEEGALVALKYGFSFIPQFVFIDKNKKENVLFYPGPLVQESQIRMRENRFCLLELQLDPRWGSRDFQKLKVYDLKKRDFIFQLEKTKFRSAVINHDGTKILATEWNESQKQNLVIIDLKTKESHRINFPEQFNITSFDWLNNEYAVAVIKNYQEQKQIIQISLTSGSWSVLKDWDFFNLGNIISKDSQILVESPESGLDNIFQLKQGKLLQITSSLFGAYSPEIFEDHLYYNDYSYEGMKIVKKKLAWNEAQENKITFYPVYKKFSSFEMKDAFTEDLKEYKKYESKKYNELKNSINFHSWMILAPPLSNTISLIGFSQDILNKFQVSAGAQYNLNERAGLLFSNLSWSYFFPVYDLLASYGKRRQKINQLDEEDSWEEGVVDVGVSLPWKKISNQFTQNFSIRFFSKLLHVTDKDYVGKSQLSNQTLFSPGVNSNFSFLRRTAPRDIYPLLGVKSQIHFEQGREIKSNSTSGNILSFDQRFYHPGLFMHDVFFYQFGVEKQQAKDYQYSSQILAPRGSKNYFFTEYYKYSANYAFPISYPDWSWERYFYLKRVFTNVFYDLVDPRFVLTDSISSAGWEILFETHFFRLMLPITWGVRGSYLLTGPDKNTENYELFLSSTVAVF